MRWPEARIREELQRLDRLTGLQGSRLPIYLGKATRTLGAFVSRQGVPLRFRFSQAYFEDPRFSEYEAYNTIRHEYAHYMNLMLYGEARGHGKTWKACCRVVGARPSAQYRGEENAVHLRQEQEQALEAQALSALAVGCVVEHPVYGRGTVCAVEKLPGIVRLELAFQGGLRKKLSAQWVAEHCVRMG